jgi:hypothetical protein
MTETTTNEPFAPVTVDLTERSRRALEIGAELTGYSKTDTMNRALQLYAFAQQLIDQGADLLVMRPGSPALEKLELS